MNIDNYNYVEFAAQVIFALPFFIAVVWYIVAAIASSRHHKQWPLYRMTFFVFGIICAIITVIGPLGKLAHTNFIAHMIGHLLLGMLAPLLIVLAAPMTLLFRSLPVTSARSIARVLKSHPVRVLMNPAFTSLLNIGGLWLLYTTDLYSLMLENVFLHVLIHFHVFLAGYVFTASMIYIDPTPHRLSFVYRASMMVIALSGHAILSKFIYANPPDGVAVEQAKIGGMLMYYGGDAIDIIIICILCFQWYKASRPRAELSYV